MRVGFDLRPALFGRSGVARVAAELHAALSVRPGLTVLPWLAAARRPAVTERAAGLPRVPLPGRLAAALAPFGFGAETLLGPLDIFQHTDLVFAPVRRAQQVLLVHDVLFDSGRGWHAPGFVERVGPRLSRRLRRAALAIAPSARSAAQIRAWRGAPVGRGDDWLAVVSPGCDHFETAPRSDEGARLAALLRRAGFPATRADEPPPLLVLLPGTREPRKNQLALLDAFLALPEELPRGADGAPARALLLFCGARGWGCPELEARLAARSSDPALAARVGVAEDLDDADWAVALRAAALVAYPSFAEGFGFPVAEALRAGRACLTSRETPMSDLGGAAVLAVDPADGAAITAALRTLLAEPARRAELAAAGPARVAELTWAAAAASVHALYERIVADTRSSR